MPSHQLTTPVVRKIKPADLTKSTHSFLVDELRKRGLDLIEEIADAYHILKYHENTTPAERLQALINIGQLCLSEKRLEAKATGAGRSQVNILINNPAK